MTLGRAAHDPTSQVRLAFRVFVHGQLKGVTRARLARLVAEAGGEIEAKPATADLVALAHSTAPRTLAAMSLPASIPLAAQLVSETSLNRRLKLLPTSDD